MTAVPNQAASALPPSHEGESHAGLLRALLEESRELTAVERFAKLHESDAEPAQAKHYRDLIPLSKPGEGEQYAFEVDLDACSGCKACVSACHHMNGLEENETWRSVGQLYGANGLPIIQHVTTACHHCVDPGCLNGCPTNAYVKDEDTGIVRHLDDQCFGCQYCTMACPYEVPQYSSSKGIVRKCDMCHGRLAEGEAPACVQACPNEAIKIKLVDTAEATRRGEADLFLPSSPPAELTKPTTVYRSEHPLPATVRGADADHVEPQHAHLPLVFMLVLTQASVGGVTLGVLAQALGHSLSASMALVAGTAAGLLGLALAPLHLGRPHLAFRSVLGWRHSWLSREAIVFGVYAPAAIALSTVAAWPLLGGWLPEGVSGLAQRVIESSLRLAAAAGAVFAGIAGVYCSGRIYEFTGRVFWSGWRTAARFGGTTVVLGLALLVCSASVAEAVAGEPAPMAALILLVIVSSSLKLAYEATMLRPQAERPLAQSAKLMKGALRSVTNWRFITGLFGGVALPILIAASDVGSVMAIALAGSSLLLLTVGELLERYLYFAAVTPLRMPGGLKA